MYQIIDYVYRHTHSYKSEKSLYNIITGKKSHQTFFDASSQQLLSLYHSLPHLKYPSFERYILQSAQHEDRHTSIKVHPRFTFDSLIRTFKALQLLIQTISHYLNDSNHFIPVTENIDIQQRVKSLFIYLRDHQCFDSVLSEVQVLFKLINEINSNSHLHYYLQGYEEVMYTRQQVSLIEDLPMDELQLSDMNDLVTLLNLIEDDDNFPFISQLIMYPALLRKTAETYHLLSKGLNPQAISEHQKVKLNTIEDHILELYIKGYLKDYWQCLPATDTQKFLEFYQEEPSLRLREYKTRFDELEYFQIKLAIVGKERGDLSVKEST